jgi:hypothetical protein
LDFRQRLLLVAAKLRQFLHKPGNNIGHSPQVVKPHNFEKVEPVVIQAVNRYQGRVSADDVKPEHGTPNTKGG